MEVTMYYVGIDWSHSHYDLCIIDDQGTIRDEFTISEDPKGFSHLLERLQSLGESPEEFQLLIETRYSALVHWLLTQGYRVFEINPKVMDRFRDRYRVSGAKSDRFDAFVLANALRTDQGRFRAIRPSKPLTRRLALLTQDRRRFLRERTALSNTLRATLKAYYPVFLRLFKDLYRPVALEFLRAYPTYQEAQQVSYEELQDFFRARGYADPKAIRRIYHTLQAGQIPVDPLVVQVKSRKALALVDQLLSLWKHLKAYDQEIERLFNRHPDRDIFLSLPGMGTTLGAEILGYLGDDRSRFQSHQEIQCCAGTAPVTSSSGGYRRVRFRWACIKGFRNALQLWAFASLTSCPWARRYYLALRKRGKTHHHALRCLANKWVKILFRMWKDRTPYDETRLLADMVTQRLLAA